MDRWYKKLAPLAKHYETLLYIGLLGWLTIFHLSEKEVYTWRYYGRTIAVLMLAHLPVLIFFLQKEKWKQVLTRNKYLLYWCACFLIYLPALSIVTSFLLKPEADLRETIITSGVCGLLLELLLVATAWYRARMLQWEWIKRLSLEKSVLISIVLIAVMLSVMAVSSIGNPKYDNGNSLLLGYEFNMRKVFNSFGVFSGFVIQFLFLYLCGYFFFYINNRLLVPKLLKQKGVILYLLGALTMIGITYPIVAQLLIWLPLNTRLGRAIIESNPFDFENAFGAMGIVFLSLPVVLALQWSRQNSRIISLEKEKAETELDLLKQQLNPHFFFNTLNNLYALSLQQSKQTPECILQLSELMRYVIYKAKEPAVKVQEEVKYLEDYMQLQQIRLKRKSDIQFNQEIAIDSPPIAPLLLMVLVENAFKHGIEPAEEKAFVHLSLHTTANRLQFSCVNSFEQDIEKEAGIGLANLQRRLALLYPGKHRLRTGIENHTFKAELELDLS